MSKVNARLKGQEVEVEATPVVDVGEPTGEELPLED